MIEPGSPEDGPEIYVSTGDLPSVETTRALVDEAFAKFRSVDEGENSTVYPALARVPADLFGLCVVGVNGNEHVVGDAAYEFAIMSVSKPFVFALVCDLLGPDEAHSKLGANPTGLPFNSLEAVERSVDGRTNPMVNAGAMATTSLVPGGNPEEKWEFILRGLSNFAGRALNVNAEVFASASATNHRNQAIAKLLQSRSRIYGDPVEAVDLYTRQCSINIDVRDLAVMGATLSNGGVNPLTEQRIVSADACHYTLAVMTSAGLYEASGDWLYAMGLPGKSGIGGGIVMVGPGKGSLATFSPRLDTYGNSVRGQLAARFLSRALGLGLFFSRSRIVQDVV